MGNESLIPSKETIEDELSGSIPRSWIRRNMTEKKHKWLIFNDTIGTVSADIGNTWGLDHGTKKSVVWGLCRNNVG